MKSYKMDNLCLRGLLLHDTLRFIARSLFGLLALCLSGDDEKIFLLFAMFRGGLVKGNLVETTKYRRVQHPK